MTEHARPSDKPERRGVGRRALLTGAGIGGLSAAAASVGEAVAGPADDRPAPSHRQPIYRETEHIRRFYARSRF